MTNRFLFDVVSLDCSRNVTEKYSTSFFSAINLLNKDLRQPICNIYGFVRFADEIVDTFHEHDKAILLDEFVKETYKAIERKFSLNPILQSFQITFNQFNIPLHLVEAFLYSMELDLKQVTYDTKGYLEYIYGSAEVVGLMCLKVFCESDDALFESLNPTAKSLGAAFQKINFLRDIKADYEGLSRVYFPNCDFSNFSEKDKLAIEKDIQSDFENALKGIKLLPQKARLGVYVAYKYYHSLFKKIKKVEPQKIMNERIRIADTNKLIILAKASVRNQLNIL